MEQSCRFSISVLSRWPHAGSSFAGLRCVLAQVGCALVKGCERCYLLLPSFRKLTKSIKYNLHHTALHPKAMNFAIFSSYSALMAIFPIHVAQTLGEAGE